MKIAIITPTFPPYAGGIGNVAAYNAKELLKLGYDITVFTPFYRPAEEEIKNIKIKRLTPVFTYGNAALIPGFARLLFDFDIIHLHYPFFGGAELIWKSAGKFKKRGIKMVLHYHMDVVGEGIMKAVFSFHTKMILPRIIDVADKVIFTSLDYGRHSNISGLIGRNPGKFVEVPNGVDVENFQPTAKDKGLLNKYCIGSDEKVILFVGGLDKPHYFKGVEYLIEAMSRLRQTGYKWRLLIVGEGELKKDYQDLCTQLGIESKTVFSGYVANEDLPKHYNLSDVAVLPSVDKSEAFGLTLVEAMSCGKPVIASNLVGVRSVFENQKQGLLILPKNADDLASKINYLLSNSEVAWQFGYEGRRRVEQKYSWTIIGRQLDELYKNLTD